VNELESEAARLAKSLDSHKAAAQEFEAAANKKAEDLSKELIDKVRNSLLAFTSISRHLQTSQVSQLKQRLQSYNDYDEIKRELEIMKVLILAISRQARADSI
jgi:homeobox protein cut-like